MTPRGNTDNKLYVPDSSQMGDMAWREWEIEFDVPQILPAPVQDITKLLDTASSANVIAVDTTGSAKYGQSVSASEYKDLFGPQHGLFLRQNKPVSGKSVSNVIIQADGALSLTGHSVVTMVLPARAEEKCLPGLTFSVSFADQIAGETVLLSNKSDGVSFVLATSDFKSFALTLTDSNSAATSTVQFEAKCTWPEEKKDEKKSDEKKSDAKKTWNTVTVIQSATAEKHVGFKVYLGATCYADTLVDTACASFNAAVAGTRACAEAPFPESKIAFCEGFNGSASNLCVWRFALTEQQVSLFGNQALSDFIDEYKESEVAVAKENIKFAASGVLPKNVSFTLNVPEGEEQKTEIKLPEQKVDNSPLSEPEACQILFDHLRGSNELMDHKQFCDLVLLVDPPDVPDASDFAQMCTELGSPNGLNFTAFQNLFNEGPPVSATTVCTRLNLHRQSSQQQLLTQHGPSGHAVAKSTMSYVDTGVVVSSDLKITYTPNVESKTRQYTLSLVFTLDKYPEETGALVHIQNEVGQAALEVNSDGCLVVFGSVCDDKLSLSDVHTLIMAYSGDMGYGYVVLDSKVVAFFQSRHKKHLLQRYIVLFNGLEGSIARLILDSQVMALSKARAPADAASQEDFFDRVVATGFQPSWVKLALKEAEVERPTQATEWIMTRYVELCAAYAIEVANRSKLAVRSTLASMGFPMKWCAEALENATLSEAENEEITKGPAIATGLLLQKGLQYILANLQRLVATEPDIVIDPIITRDSSKINIDTGDEKKATASQSLSMIPDEGNDDDNAGAEDTSSKSFYAAVAASNGNVLGDVPLNVPPPLTKKSTAREKKSTAKAEEAFTKFQSSRLVSEKSLTLVYARTALLNVLAGDPQKLFQQDFAWLLRAMEHSFPEGLDILRDLFVDAILREAPTLADVAAPTPAQGLLIDTKRAPVMAKLVQEALFQLLAAAKIENGQNNEASTIQGSCANPRLAIFLLDLFFYVTSDLANQKGTDTAAQLRHLRPHLFNPLLVGLVFEVIPCTSPNYRLQFLRIISSLLNLNKKEGPVNSVYFEPQRCQAIKALMIKVYKTKTGAPSSFLRSLVELNVSVADELEALEAAEKAEAEAAEKAEAEAKAAAEKAAEWECEACTLVNPKDCTKCDACETPKPAGSDEDDLDGAKPAIVETKEETDTKEIDTKEEPSTGAIVRSASINTEGPLEMFWPLCQYSGPGDKNGIFYFLGSNMGLDSKWNNPATSDIVTVESSASAPGFIVNDFLKRSAFSSQGDKMCVEGSEANPAWISVQLGAWVVKPYCYSLRSPHSSGHLRNWNLEARLDEGPWVVLSENNEQASLSTADGICTWPLFMADPVKSEAMYNSFRIVLTGPNAAGALKLRAAGFELYGQLARRPTIEEDLEVPVVAAVVTEADAKEEKESKVEAAPLPVVVRPRVRIGNVASPQWFIDLSDMLKIMSFFSNQDVKSVPDRYNDFINGAQLSRAGWAELAGLMNAWSLKNSNASPDPAQLTIDDASLRGFSQLQNCGLDEKALRGCMHALVLFNSQVNSNMDFFDLQLPPHRSVLVDGLRDCCDLVFSASKIGNWNQALQSTQQGENRVTINVNPMSAATFQETGKVDEKANQTFWGQAFSQLRTRPSTMFRIAFGGRAFKCDYAGMRSIDAGGPYRDVIERMSMDIMAPYCGLFIKSPNQIAQLGENRNCFVPNPAATSRLQLEQFEFLGKMMGLALRTRNLLNIRVTSVVWKALVGASITMSDIEAIDVLSTNALKGLHVEEKNMPVELYNTEMADIKFTVTGSDSKVHELCKGGRTKSLTYANRQEYAALSFNFRSTEFAVQTAAIRRGLGKVVPLASLGLFSWRELETMVCGRGFAADQVELLKTNTTYKSYSATDQHIVWLWDILENDFTDEQRAMYLTFVWGRSRMPNTSAEFDTPHKISSRSGGNQAFPMAHTCFNTIDLPVYTDRAIMSQRLATAISMCGVIDGD
jgi:ferredoxin